VCHGVPNKRKLKKGEFLNIDVVAYVDGFHGDTSGMACVGTPHPDINRLVIFIKK
jgi:methionyl aminopeptidase